MPQPRDVLAAGAVVTRKGKQVLLVHRPAYDDWSFPKGKLDRGEHAAVAAVREVAEETGAARPARPAAVAASATPTAADEDRRLLAGLGRRRRRRGRLPGQPRDRRGRVGRRSTRRRPLLTYPRDRETLAEARKRARKTRALVVLRHASARSRKAWRKSRDDRLRPLLRSGELQAAATWCRCWRRTTSPGSSPRAAPGACRPCGRTPTPPAGSSRSSDGLSEEDATAKTVVRVVDELLDSGEGAVLCTHRPVLPAVFDALGIPELHLEPGGMLVVHHRKGKVVATEHHSRPEVKVRTGCSRDGRLRGEILWTTGRFEFTPRSPTPTHRVTCPPYVPDVRHDKTSGERSEEHFLPPGDRARHRRPLARARRVRRRQRRRPQTARVAAAPAAA